MWWIAHRDGDHPAVLPDFPPRTPQFAARHSTGVLGERRLGNGARRGMMLQARSEASKDKRRGGRCKTINPKTTLQYHPADNRVRRRDLFAVFSAGVALYPLA